MSLKAFILRNYSFRCFLLKSIKAIFVKKVSIKLSEFKSYSLARFILSDAPFFTLMILIDGKG